MQLDLGNNIRQLRRRDKKTQEALAEALGVTPQAVSRWESGGSYPDMNLIPAIASYFRVSIDELFSYNVWENNRTVDEICRKAAKLIVNDASAADELLKEALKQFPGNENLLIVWVYALWVLPGRDEDLIAACKTLIDCATDEGVRCDVLRFLAMVYHRNNKTELIRPVLDQIPEFYFTKKECIAKLMTGQESLDAARFQMNISGKSLIEMLGIMQNRYAEAGDCENASLCQRLSDGVLTLFRNEGGKSLEIFSHEWLGN